MSLSMTYAMEAYSEAWVTGVFGNRVLRQRRNTGRERETNVAPKTWLLLTVESFESCRELFLSLRFFRSSMIFLPDFSFFKFGVLISSNLKAEESVQSMVLVKEKRRNGAFKQTWQALYYGRANRNTNTLTKQAYS